ncbi:unnamed protein product [Rotaria sp. Silwood2]|nr:unnamed protein product [Rotaria sp. Silwood2]CAF2644382.1 unnamed protein product [Rotaria sp. Silwood2]CAF2903980.1 unnamed protein product [Rotaria sp. Silwood2]CAF3071244.1 unnamed protein product [Rotaria sp. Silwood2]CAF3905250.1 unnamed protein product [Rotaria sp. Silwood2]
MANLSDEQLQKEFRRLDKNDDKSITVAELKQYYVPMQEMLGVPQEIAEQEIQGFMKRLDVDHDGRITFDEFKKFVKRA